LPDPRTELDDAQKSQLALLRTEGVSIKYMEETKREELRRFLVFLHVEKGMSLNDVANLVGNKTSGGPLTGRKRTKRTCSG